MALRFEDLLEAEPRPVGGLHEALETARQAIPKTDNLGQTQDETDLYWVMDQLTQAIKEAFPGGLCKAGCGSCCYFPTSLFDISRSEWDAIEAYVRREWDEDRLERFRERFRASFSPYLRSLGVWDKLIAFPLPVLPTAEAIPLACPFLENEACSIYPVRPLPCRTFGHYATKMWAWGRDHVYACGMQGSVLQGQLEGEGPRPKLPHVAPFRFRLAGLARGKKHLIPVWVSKRLLRR